MVLSAGDYVAEQRRLRFGGRRDIPARRSPCDLVTNKWGATQQTIVAKAQTLQTKLPKQQVDGYNNRTLYHRCNTLRGWPHGGCIDNTVGRM